MIISNLVGGLGNQMFQYACGRALSLKTRQPLSLAVDQFVEYHQHNGLELFRVFNLKTPVANKKELRTLLGFRGLPKIRRLLYQPFMSWATGENCYIEPHFDYWAKIEDINRPAYIQGYWQSELYFANTADIIRAEFNFRNPMDALDMAVRDRMASSPCASLHVRRGDYLTGKFKKVYATCDVSYYVSAVQLLRSKIPNIRLFAFSDEPDWVARHLKSELGDIEVVSHNIGSRSSNDMHLMSLADHHIIANSSFSWWGAWLNPSKEKIVIAPKVWFADGRPTPTLIPSSWIRI